MISARSGRTELTDMLLTGEIIDTDIQENVRLFFRPLSHDTYMYSFYILSEGYSSQLLIYERDW